MKYDKNRTLIYNIAFIAVSAGLLLFLLNAPEETTAKLPLDTVHNKFQPMEKKHAETFCEECHTQDGESPLPPEHPPKYRCLLCHKKADK